MDVSNAFSAVVGIRKQKESSYDYESIPAGFFTD